MTTDVDMWQQLFSNQAKNKQLGFNEIHEYENNEISRKLRFVLRKWDFRRR